MVFDIAAIKEFLPHRYPFLLVDRILEMDDTRIVGLKNVSANEPFFQGHFPQKAVMPGVLIIEAMAQVAGVHHREENRRLTHEADAAGRRGWCAVPQAC